MLARNVGRSGGNRLLLFSLFCRVGLFFVLECPVGRDRVILAHEEHDIEVLSYVEGSGVAVYTRRLMLVCLMCVDIGLMLVWFVWSRMAVLFGRWWGFKYLLEFQVLL